MSGPGAGSLGGPLRAVGPAELSSLPPGCASGPWGDQQAVGGVSLSSARGFDEVKSWELPKEGPKGHIGEG